MEIRDKIIPILVHHRDLLLGNMFPYMPKIIPMPSSWKNHLDGITDLDILISNNHLWCNSVHAFKPFIE